MFDHILIYMCFKHGSYLLMDMRWGVLQGLRASSLQFTSPLEFNAIFREGFPLRHELTAGSKIRDPVPAKFKHVTNIVICTLLCCDYVTYVPALKFPKS